MFIQNSYGDVVNLDHVIAIKAYVDEAPPVIHVFTDKTETIFNYISQDNAKSALNRIKLYLREVAPHWITCKNVMLRADNVLSIEEYHDRVLHATMTDRVIKIHCDTSDDGEDLEAVKLQIARELARCNILDRMV